MKVGDLVIWIGKDSDHGLIGIIAAITSPEHSLYNRTTYDVQWADGTDGLQIYDTELMVLDNDPER